MTEGQISVQLNVTGSTEVVITAVSYSGTQQEVAIVPQWAVIEPMGASGQGMGVQLNNWTMQLTESGSFPFGLSFQYGPTGAQSPNVNQSLMTMPTAGGTLNQLFVVSVNGSENRDCCIVTFVWFS